MAIDISKKRPASGGASAKASPHKKPKYDGAKPSTSKPDAGGVKKSKYQSKPGASGSVGGGGKPGGKPGIAKKPGFQNKFAKPAPPGQEAKPFEKQDWNKFKKEKKELKLKRKQGDNKDLFELTIEGKKVYEELRW